MGSHRHVDTDQRDVGVAIAGQAQRGVKAALSAARVSGQADELAAVLRIAVAGLDLGHDRVVAALRHLGRRLILDVLLSAGDVQVGTYLHSAKRCPVDRHRAAALGIALDAHGQVGGGGVLGDGGHVVDGIKPRRHVIERRLHIVAEATHVRQPARCRDGRARCIGGIAMALGIAVDLRVNLLGVAFDVADAADADADKRTDVASARLVGSANAISHTWIAHAGIRTLLGVLLAAQSHGVCRTHFDRAVYMTNLLADRLATRRRFDRRSDPLRRLVVRFLSSTSHGSGFGSLLSFGSALAASGGLCLLCTMAHLRAGERASRPSVKTGQSRTSASQRRMGTHRLAPWLGWRRFRQLRKRLFLCWLGGNGWHPIPLARQVTSALGSSAQ
jgi:hypothetical protein